MLDMEKADLGTSKSCLFLRVQNKKIKKNLCLDFLNQLLNLREAQMNFKRGELTKVLSQTSGIF